MRMRAEQGFYLGHADGKRVNEFHNLDGTPGLYLLIRWDSVCG